MEFDFNVNKLLKPDNKGIAIVKGNSLPFVKEFAFVGSPTTPETQLIHLINIIGKASSDVD